MVFNDSMELLDNANAMSREPRASVSPIPSLPARVGIIAGWGDFPVLVAKSLHERGIQVYAAMLHGHANPELAAYCQDVQWSGVSKLSCKIRFFRRHQVQSVTMAGKLFKTVIFQQNQWLKHVPDLRFVRYFFHHFVTNKAGGSDDQLLLTVVKNFEDAGLKMTAATDFAPHLLIRQGVLTERKVSQYQWNDIAFGWQLAKEMGRLDIGQTVVVKNRAVVAIEAIEGTDQCIERAGQLCPVGGFTVVKVAKPQQDMRFDVPTIGVGTLEKIYAAGGRVLVIQANKTIVLHQDEVIDFANRHQMTLIAVGENEIARFAKEMATIGG